MSNSRIHLSGKKTLVLIYRTTVLTRIRCVVNIGLLSSIFDFIHKSNYSRKFIIIGNNLITYVYVYNPCILSYLTQF